MEANSIEKTKVEWLWIDSWLFGHYHWFSLPLPCSSYLPPKKFSSFEDFFSSTHVPSREKRRIGPSPFHHTRCCLPHLPETVHPHRNQIPPKTETILTLYRKRLRTFLIWKKRTCFPRETVRLVSISPSSVAGGSAGGVGPKLWYVTS